MNFFCNINIVLKFFFTNVFIIILITISYDVRAEIMERTLDNGMDRLLPPVG